jgi:hypothetical protein
MVTWLGISLYSYPYFKLAKMPCLSYYCLYLLLSKIGEEGRTASVWKQGKWGEEGGSWGQGKEWPKQRMHMWINELKRPSKRKAVLRVGRNLVG